MGICLEKGRCMYGELSTTPALVGLPAGPVNEADQPRRLAVRYSRQDKVFIHGVRAVAFLVLVIVSAIGLFLGVQAFPTLNHYGLSFFTEYRWLPSQDIIGIAAVVVGTIEV